MNTTLQSLNARIRLMRPSHWVKNAFIFAPPVYGKALMNTESDLRAVMTFFAFCFVSSSVYILNDIVDRNADSQHPKKKHRPIASGAVSVGSAVVQLGLVAAVAVALASQLPWQAGACIAIYAVLNLGYSFGLKHVVLLDIFIIAAGFMLRVLTGGKAIQVVVSEWLIICTLFLSLFFSDQLWLWGRGYEGGGPYLPLMQKTVQWLLRNPALEEEALRMRTDNGRLIIERQTMADKSDPMKIVAPSGKSVSLTPSQIAPGLWQASLPADELEVGLYSAAQDGRTPLKTYFNIGTANPREFSRTVSTLEIVKPLSEKTGGHAARMADGAGNYVVPAIKLLKPDDAKKGLSGSAWVGVRATTAGKPTRIDREPVVPLPLSIGFVLAMMSLSFAREGNHKWLRPENWLAKKPAAGDQPSV